MGQGVAIGLMKGARCRTKGGNWDGFCSEVVFVIWWYARFSIFKGG